MTLALGPQRFALATSPDGGGVTPLPMPASVASIVFIGDSFVQGTGASDAAHRLANKIALGLGNATLINNGIAGTLLQNSNDKTGVPTASNARNRYFNVLVSPPNKAEFAVIMNGFNDSRYVAAPSTINVTNYAIQAEEIVVDLLINGYAPNQIMLVSPWWITDTGLASGSANPDFNGQDRAVIEQYVAAAHAICVKYGIYDYNAYAYMRDHGGAAWIGPDTIHPNDAGHDGIAVGALACTRVPVAVLPLPSFFFVDNFTDTPGTSLVAHVSDSGATWGQQTGGTTAATLTATDVWSVGGGGIFRASAVPPTGNTAVRGYFTKLTTINDNIGVTVRASNAANTFYFFRLNTQTAVYQLFRTVTGSSFQLGTDLSASAMATGELRSLEVRAIDNQISGWVNNVKVIEIADANIPKGSPDGLGIRMGNAQSATTGIHMTKLTAQAL